MALGVYTKILKDDFNRANEEPATGWTDNEAAGLRIVSNTLTSGAGGGSAYWTANPVLINFEAYLTIATLPSAADYLKFRSDGTNFYQYNWGNGDIRRFPGDIFLFNTTLQDTDVVVGDEWAVQAIGSRLEIFKNGGSRGSGTDATIASGRFEPTIFGTASYDSFSLGTYLPSDTPFPPLGRGASW